MGDDTNPGTGRADRAGPLGPYPGGMSRRCAAVLVAALFALAMPACADERTCPRWETAALPEALTLPEAPGLPGPLWRDAETGRPWRAEANADDRALLLDPRPHQRGEHLMWRVERGLSCEVIALPTLAGPALAADVLAEGGDLGPGRFGPALRDRRLGGLVLETEGREPGSPRTWDAWPDLLSRLGIVGERVTATAGLEGDNGLERAIEAALGEVDPGGLFVFVVSGPGSAAGPGLVYGRIGQTRLVVSWSRLTAALGRHGGHLGLLIWVVDAAWAAEVSLPLGVPSVLVRGSDRVTLDAPRLTAGGPSALAPAWSDAVNEALARRCLTPEAPPDEPGELAAVLVEAAVRLRPAMLTRRWEAIGLPALVSLVSAGEADPRSVQALKVWLEGQAPREVVAANAAGRTPALRPACERDDDCGGRVCGPCRLARCEAGACVAAIDVGRPCDDGEGCTLDDACDEGGRCRGVERDCDDGDPCTDDACEAAAGCVHTVREGATCDDGDPCTDGETCDAAGTCSGVARACDDLDPCTVDTCEAVGGEAACIHTTRDRLACDDADPCTLGDVCRGGICAGAPRPCADANPCTLDRCDPATGACVFLPVADLVSCEDGDPCTSVSRCRDGRCEGSQRRCDDGVACTFDQCGADGTCRHLPAPGTCLSPIAGEGCIPVGARPSGRPCLVCAATDVLVGDDGAACGPGEGCAARRCVAGQCVVADDGASCSTPEGGCVGVGERVTECLVCEGGGVVEALTGGPCGGPAACGLGACQAGVCARVSPAPCCPTRLLQCGESWEVGPEDYAGLDSRVDVWSAGPAPGPERWFEVAAPCDGGMAVTVTPLDGGEATLALGATACVPGLVRAGAGGTAPWPCEALAPTHEEVPVAAAQVVRLALEVGPGGGRYLVSTRCECLP